MVDKLYHRANPRSSLRPITHFVVEIQRFVCDRAKPPIINCDRIWENPPYGIFQKIDMVDKLYQ